MPLLLLPLKKNGRNQPAVFLIYPPRSRTTDRREFIAIDGGGPNFWESADRRCLAVCEIARLRRRGGRLCIRIRIPPRYGRAAAPPSPPAEDVMAAGMTSTRQQLSRSRARG